MSLDRNQTRLRSISWLAEVTKNRAELAKAKAMEKIFNRPHFASQFFDKACIGDDGKEEKDQDSRIRDWLDTMDEARKVKVMLLKK